MQRLRDLACWILGHDTFFPWPNQHLAKCWRCRRKLSFPEDYWHD